MTRPLGRTGLTVSPIGFGAFKIGRNEGTKYPAGYELPDDAAVDRLLNGALDLGVTHIDTAPAYGTSEERIGRFLGGRRREFVLSTKVGEIFENGRSRYDFSDTAIRASVEQSLARMQTDVLDVIFIHAPADDVGVMRETDAVATLADLKRAGAVRAIGLSAKTIAGANHALDWADVLMVEYHPLDLSFAPVISAAAARDVGVVVKKGLASGCLPAETAIPLILKTPGVTNLVIGGLNLDHLRQNVELARRTLIGD
ncbi:MAG: aldo/keto reductase [Planctomycetaceae bacterium]